MQMGPSIGSVGLSEADVMDQAKERLNQQHCDDNRAYFGVGVVVGLVGFSKRGSSRIQRKMCNI